MQNLMNTNFYSVVATVIPVLLLGLALEAGLWRRIANTITTTKVTSVRGSIIIVRLQLLAFLVILLGTYGELAALYALWRQHINTVNSWIVFIATASLVILLGITLAAQIPGLLRVTRSLELMLESEESLRWSGDCRRFVGGRWTPLRFGKLFLTDRRLVWMNAPAGGYPADDIEIRSREFHDIRFDQLNWARASTVLRLYRPIFAHIWPHTMTVTTTSGESYHFLIRETAYDEMVPHLRAFLPGGTAQPGEKAR
jgi:hypothetical protein